MHMGLVLESLGFATSRLPDRAINGLASMLTWLGFSVVRLRRAIVLNNLKIAFPQWTEAQRRHIAKLSYRNFILTCFEFVRGKYVDLARDVQLEGVEHLHQALAEGCGAYILCMHMGNWEAMGAAVNRVVCPARVVVKQVGSAKVNRWVNTIRRLNGFQVIDRKSKGDGVRAILKTLRDGEIVGFVMDQARPGEPRLPFFGQPAKTNTSLAAFWLRRPAPIIPSYSRRTAVGQHVVTFLPPLDLKRTGNRENDILAASQTFNDTLATMITRAPEHYFWLHNRWK